MNTRSIEKLILPILVFLAVILILPANLYALEVGVSTDLATAAYLGGVFVGLIIMLPYVFLTRRSDQNKKKEDEKSTESRSSIRPFLTVALIILMAFMIYPVRVYAPGAKALFIPLVYWGGVILGVSLMGVALLWERGIWERSVNEGEET